MIEFSSSCCNAAVHAAITDAHAISKLLTLLTVPTAATHSLSLINNMLQFI